MSALFRQVEEVVLSNGAALRAVRQNGERAILLTYNIGDEVVGYRACIKLTLKQAMRLSRGLAGIASATEDDRADTEPR
ncbi:MAG: hypothetical protein KJO40_18310 [Deltaproteobacteria bacterium]|nr:hypothetical protein [Deltaproteobacteria bacterium]